MKRVPEPELMLSTEEAEAYGNADFEEPHSNFISLLKSHSSAAGPYCSVLDLGSGTGDIVLRFAREYTDATIDAVDGSSAMLEFAENHLGKHPSCRKRVALINSRLQEFSTDRRYDLIMSNSLLHHMHDPAHFWNKIKEHCSSGTFIFIMDLLRPTSISEARELLELYTQGEPEILKTGFYNSLLAAFKLEDIREQIFEAGLGFLEIKAVSDRHLIIYGECE